MEISNNEYNPLDQVENENESPLISFTVPLFIFGNDEDTFHAKNNGKADWQRRNIAERVTKATLIQCSLLDVIHGKLKPTAESPSATLMLLKFRLDPLKSDRRLVRAEIGIEFFPKDPMVEAPVVLAIGIDDRWRISPTVDHEEIKKTRKVNLGLSGGSIAQAGGEASLEKVRGNTIHDAITVTGNTRFGKDIESGHHTACKWTLLENTTQKSGIPCSLTVPVLLQRDNDEQFNAVVSFSVRGDTKTTLEEMFNKIPVDDPVHFNPTVDRLSETPVEGYKKKRGQGNKKKIVKPLVQKYAKHELGRWQFEMDKLVDVK